MKKFFLFLLLISSFFLSGCTYVMYENAAEGRALNRYIQRDLFRHDNFTTYVNDIYKKHVQQTLKVEYTITPLFGESQVTYLTATIIEQSSSSNYVYAIMPLMPIDATIGTKTGVIVYDYVNDDYTAAIIDLSEELGIMLIRYKTATTTYTLANNRTIIFPLEGQVVSVVGAQNQTNNRVELGIIDQVDQAFIYIRSSSEQSGNGSVVLNIYYEWIGIQIAVDGNIIKVIPAETIIDWINSR
ncbi:MAG: hypothetical protein WC964_01275 [Acholeplasmataceae bacterium]